jgi:hypothetical protein
MATATRQPMFDSPAFRLAARRVAKSGPGWLSALPELLGQRRDCEAAERVRAKLLARFGGNLEPFTLKAMLGIRDARWWLNNRDARTAFYVQWPLSWFSTRPRPSVPN